jgi:hypothetical protein
MQIRAARAIFHAFSARGGFLSNSWALQPRLYFRGAFSAWFVYCIEYPDFAVQALFSGRFQRLARFETQLPGALQPWAELRRAFGA